MNKVKIRIDLSDAWMYDIVTEESQSQRCAALGFDPEDAGELIQPMTLEVDQELVDQYHVARTAMDSMRDVLLNLYRIKRGKPPLTGLPLPAHIVLPKEP